MNSKYVTLGKIPENYIKNIGKLILRHRTSKKSLSTSLIIIVSSSYDRKDMVATSNKVRTSKFAVILYAF